MTSVTQSFLHASPQPSLLSTPGVCQKALPHQVLARLALDRGSLSVCSRRCIPRQPALPSSNVHLQIPSTAFTSCQLLTDNTSSSLAMHIQHRTDEPTDHGGASWVREFSQPGSRDALVSPRTRLPLWLQAHLLAPDGVDDGLPTQL